MARFCTRCGKQVGILESVVSYGPHRRCKVCNTTVEQYLKQWRDAFRLVWADGLLTRDEWANLERILTERELDRTEALAYVRRDALTFVERTFAFAKSDGQIEEDEEQQIRWLLNELSLQEQMSYLLPELDYLVRLREIRIGKLQTVRPTIVLPADELCYLETQAAYRKVGKSSTTDIPGRMIVTNKKILFVAQSGGGEIPLNKVLNVTTHPTGVFLELSRQANNGFYVLPQAELAAEIILSVVRMSTRQLVAMTTRDTRRIPQHIKTEVWQRDQGRCVQCSASEYLEFDHVIPHSKGGATSVNNLQLLCRKCNLAKSDTL